MDSSSGSNPTPCFMYSFGMLCNQARQQTIPGPKVQATSIASHMLKHADTLAFEWESLPGVGNNPIHCRIGLLMNVFSCFPQQHIFALLAHYTCTCLMTRGVLLLLYAGTICIHNNHMHIFAATLDMWYTANFCQSR